MDFHSALLFFAYYGFILRFWGNFLGFAGMGDEHGSILSFCILGVFAFWSFLGTFLALFWHFFGFSGHLGILKVLVSYWVTRVIILVVGTVYGGFWVGLGGSRGVWGGPGGSRGGLLYPSRALFAPLEVCTALDLVPNTT